MSLRKTLAAFATSVIVSTASSGANAAVIDLGFALDESGSVSRSNFDLAKNGLAAALAQVPVMGANVYRISVVAFGRATRTIVPVTEVTAATLSGIQDDVRNINYAAGSATAIGDSIAELTENFVAAGLGDRSLFNVTTDGQNTIGVLPSSAASAAAAAGIDGLSFEAVGNFNTSTIQAIAFPGTTVLINDAADIPDLTTGSFVFNVDSFADYEAAIAAKVGRIVIDTGGGGPTTSPIPLPAGMPLLLAGLGMLAVARRRSAAA